MANGAVLDVAKIEKELQSINQQRSQARERLDALRAGRGRGRGPPIGPRGDVRPGIMSRLGDNSANGGPIRDAAGASRPSVLDRLYSQGSRGSDRLDWPHRSGRHAGQAPDDSDPADQQLSKRLSSRISGAVVEASSVDDERTGREDAGQPESTTGRKRLLSAVMVDGQAKPLSGPAERALGSVPDAPPAKRPTLSVDDRTKRRAARMFGTLLVGTLQKFQSDEQAFKKSDTAQRRAEMERRAAERAEAEAQRLRDEAAATWRQERSSKLNALHDLNLQAGLKALELRFAKRIQLKEQQAGYFMTSTQPPLCWLPKQISKESEPLLQQAQQALETWKQQQMQELEAEKAELVQTAAERREAGLARLAARQPPAPGAEGEKEGHEDSEDEVPEGDQGVQHDEGAEHDGAGHTQQEQGDRQSSGDNTQQQQQPDDDMQEAGEEEQLDVEDEEQQLQSRRAARLGHQGSEDEERLLSSDDEEA